MSTDVMHLALHCILSQLGERFQINSHVLVGKSNTSLFFNPFTIILDGMIEFLHDISPLKKYFLDLKCFHNTIPDQYPCSCPCFLFMVLIQLTSTCNSCTQIFSFWWWIEFTADAMACQIWHEVEQWGEETVAYHFCLWASPSFHQSTT